MKNHQIAEVLLPRVVGLFQAHGALEMLCLVTACSTASHAAGRNPLLLLSGLSIKAHSVIEASRICWTVAAARQEATLQALCLPQAKELVGRGVELLSPGTQKWHRPLRPSSAHSKEVCGHIVACCWPVSGRCKQEH